MAAPINQWNIRFGRLDPSDIEKNEPNRQFMPDCLPGDWRSWKVGFNKEDFSNDSVRVIVTGNDHRVDNDVPNPAMVGRISEVTKNGITLAARNSDCAAGIAGFHWIAIGCGAKCP